MQTIPLALVVALSPLSIIPAVLVLHTPRPRQAGVAFLVGWLIGLTALTAIFVEVSSLAGGLGAKPPGWASWLRIVVGAALIVFGIYKWLTRKKSEHSPEVDPEPGETHARSRRRHGACVDRHQSQSAVHLRRSGSGHRHGGP